MDKKLYDTLVEYTTFRIHQAQKLVNFSTFPSEHFELVRNLHSMCIGASDLLCEMHLTAQYIPKLEAWNDHIERQFSELYKRMDRE